LVILETYLLFSFNKIMVIHKIRRHAEVSVIKITVRPRWFKERP
jgi:hypothetical protein